MVLFFSRTAGVVAALLLLGGPALAQPARPRAAAPWQRPFTRVSVASRPPSPLPAAPPTSAVVVPGRMVNYNWNGFQWADATESACTYDGQARLTQIEQLDSVTRQLQRRTTYTYAPQGQVATETDEIFFGGTAQAPTRRVSSHDAQGQETEVLLQGWVNNAWVTVGGHRALYTYDPNGTIVGVLHQQFDNGTFVDDYRTTVTLANGQWSAMRGEYWDGQQWVNDEQYVDMTWANWPALLPATFRWQPWNGNAFVDSARTTITYGANTSRVSTEERPLGPGGAWQPFVRETQDYDAQGNSLGFAAQRWTPAGAWTTTWAERNQHAYDPAGTLLRTINEGYNPFSGQFRRNYRINYGAFRTIVTGAPAEAAAAPLQLYPNPSRGTVTLTIPNRTALAGSVRDALGREVLTFTPSPAGETSLDLSALPPGVYAVEVRTLQGPLVRRLVRE